MSSEKKQVIQSHVAPKLYSNAKGRADSLGLSLAAYVRLLVSQDLKEENRHK